MRISESCAQCLYDKQKKRCPDPEYLRRVKELLDQRGEEETSPYMVYRFNLIHEQMFGREPGYQQEKKRYNDLVLGMEKDLRLRIEQEKDPLAASLAMSRIGNYIYSFLCKCDLFQRRFGAQPLTGMFIEENPDAAEDNYL